MLEEKFSIVEEHTVESVCRVCKQVIYSEVLMSDGTNSHVIVQGSYTQKCDKHGNPIGPRLGFCPQHSERVKCQ